MNLYGFAGGDPVNFSDPFGLCKNGKTEEECRKQLTDAQDAAIANPAFKRGPDNKTHCNAATYCVAGAMGAASGLGNDEGDALLAYKMEMNMAASGSGYTALSADQAQAFANKGELVIVAGPGHVATVRPDIDPSKKYPGSGPLIANVGATYGVMRLSKVFTQAATPQVKYYLSPQR